MNKKKPLQGDNNNLQNTYKSKVVLITRKLWQDALNKNGKVFHYPVTLFLHFAALSELILYS
jgi:hypothetical protein